MRVRGYTFALRPCSEQIPTLIQYAGVCRLVWNLALEQRQNYWRRYQAVTGDNLNYVTQARELTKLRAEVDFVRAVPITPLQRALKSLDDTYRRAWKGLGGFPQPKKKGAHEAFSFAGRELKVERLNRKWGRVRLPKIGWIKFRQTRDIPADIREATITRTALGWQISLCCALKGENVNPGGAIGIDRGVSVPLMLSDGSSYVMPNGLGTAERTLRKAQRIASRRKRGSARYAKAQRRVAALKARQARIRKHWAHETTTDIARRFGVVVIERLRTSKMTRSAKGTVAEPGINVRAKAGLNRAILNVGWHQIEAMLFYKAARIVKVDPSYTSQTCSSCGTVDRQSRKSQAIFDCVACGHTDNADRNAAINILNRGNTPGVEATDCGADEARSLAA